MLNRFIDINKVLSAIKGRSIIIIGDVMLDCYKYIETVKISYEAPVIVFKETGEKYVPGGAANVAANIFTLGGKPFLIGLVGDDNEAVILEELLSKIGVSFKLLRERNRVTTLKTRLISKKQQVLRLDRESIQEILPETSTQVLEIVADVKGSCDAIVLSDYAKGFFNSNIFRKISELRERMGIPLIVDPKPANDYLCNNVYLIMPNVFEAREILGKDKSLNITSEEIADALREKYNANVLLTEGEKGMVLSTTEGLTERISSYAKDVYDVTGAGDTAVAMAALCIAAGKHLREVAYLSSLAAGVAVSKFGTASVFPSEISIAARKNTKILSLENLIDLVKRIREEGKKIVFTNGCFDLLHAGHVNYLRVARGYGDFLIVALNSDESVCRLKGPNRPLMPLAQRMELVASLESVDYVVSFEEDDPKRLISMIKPDVYVKGGDYTEESLPEAPLVRSYGGEVRITPIFAEGTSTTSIIEKICLIDS